MVTLSPDTLPVGLPITERFVIWKREVRAGKPTKLPYIATAADQLASVIDSSTWRGITDAIAAAEDGKADGIGVVLNGDGLVGIDIDHCVDPFTGEPNDDARAIIASLNSYCEISPSGTGIRILVYGVLPPGRRKKGPVEVYDSGRYMTLTGAHLDGTPLTIEERTAALAAFHARHLGSTNGGNGRRPRDLARELHEVAVAA